MFNYNVEIGSSVFSSFFLPFFPFFMTVSRKLFEILNSHGKKIIIKQKSLKLSPVAGNKIFLIIQSEKNKFPWSRRFNNAFEI